MPSHLESLPPYHPIDHECSVWTNQFALRREQSTVLTKANGDGVLVTLTSSGNGADSPDIHPGHVQHPEPAGTDLPFDPHSIPWDPEPGSPSLPHLANGVELLDEVGISPYEFLSIIEQIDGMENSVLDSTS